MRLIDGDALIKDIDYSADMGGALGKVVECVKYYVKYMVASAPTIEPKKGKWIKEHWHSNNVRECSACHLTQSVTTYRGIVNFNFCPYCGADMRGD